MSAVAIWALAKIYLVHQLCSVLDLRPLFTDTYALVTSCMDYCNVIYMEIHLKTTQSSVFGIGYAGEKSQLLVSSLCINPSALLSQ